MLTLTIKPKVKETKNGLPARGGKPRKGRSFAATMLGYVTCPDLYDDRASRDTERPLRATFAGRDTELAPFITNLVSLGHSAEAERNSSDRPSRFECLRGLNYVTIWQRGCGGAAQAAVSVYIPALCEPKPPANAEDVRFVCLPPAKWVAERLQAEVLADPARCTTIVAQAARLGILADDDTTPRLPLPFRLSRAELLVLVPIATYFAKFIDMRCDVPLLPDPAFFVQLYLAALLSRYASLPQTENSRKTYTHEDKADRWFFARRRDMLDFIAYQPAAIGLLPEAGIALWCEAADLSRLVVEQTQLYYATHHLTNLGGDMYPDRLAPSFTRAKHKLPYMWCKQLAKRRQSRQRRARLHRHPSRYGKN